MLDVRSLAERCLSQLELLVRICDQVSEGDGADDICFPELSADDQLARFRVWAGNIGAFADAHASLDHRLSDNEAARQLMVGFLGTLEHFSQRGKSTAGDQRIRANCSITKPSKR